MEQTFLDQLAWGWVVIDLETTGTTVGKDEILEFAAVKIKGREIVDTYQTLIKPSCQIPLKIKRLTGINEEMVREAPELGQVLDKITEFIGNDVIVGHNVAFDTSFLEAALGRHFTNPCWDTLELARFLYPAAANHRLQTLSQILALDYQEGHRALSDTIATAQLLQKLLAKAVGLEPKLIQTVNAFMAGVNWPYKEFFQTLERHSFSILATNGSSVFDKPVVQSADETGIFSKSVNSPLVQTAFSLAEIRAFLEPGGSLARTFEHYEERPQQVKMLEAVGTAFAEDQFLVMEAGTGTGKSLAYLIPALYWAKSAGEKVVVATHTINLQEQLINKDIPNLAQVLPISFRAVLVKGRSNYICLRRWQNKLKEAGHWGEEEAKFYLRIFFWLQETVSGDKSELNLSGNLSEFWQELWADRESCLGAKCPWSKKCYLRLARRKAEEADLLVVNHSLVFSDINTANKVLPEYNYLIIDEAHHLEEEATQHLGVEVSYAMCRRYLRTLFQGFGEKLNPGVLGVLRQRLEKLTGSGLGGFNKEELSQVLEHCVAQVFSAGEGAQTLFDLLANFTRAKGGAEEEFRVSTMRLRPEHLQQEIGPHLTTAKENLVIRLTELIQGLKKLTSNLEGEDTGWDLEFTAQLVEMKSQISAGEEIITRLNFLFDEFQDNYVYWVEGSDYNTSLKGAPIKIGPLLDQHIFQQKKSVILTSATLSVDNSFEHFTERLGLTAAAGGKLILNRVDSPFHYEEQSLLCLLNDMPNPSQVPDEIYIDAIIPFLQELAVLMEGRTLILFTSHKMLRETYFRLKPNLENKDICLLGHGIDGSRSRLVEEFKANPKCVLLGASSFWEGVDLPGENLSCVVMVKLPFWPPNMPTVEARLEDLQRNGLNSFRHFTLPKAILRLKQGFGRLIRTKQDQGIVVILDPRVIGSPYGKKFLNSLPQKSHIRGDSSLVLKKIAPWLAGDRISRDSLTILNDPKNIKEFFAARKNRG